MGEYQGENFCWTHSFNSADKEILSATLEIYAYDVDPGESDRVSIDGHEIGRLTGEDGIWSTTKFEIDPNLASNVLADGKMKVCQAIESNWKLKVGWSRLSVQWEPIPVWTLTRFNWCKKTSPVLDWGAFYTKDRSSALETCLIDSMAPSARDRVMKIEYDVRRGGTYSGFWMKWGSATFDPNEWQAISFWVRGDATMGFTTKIKVELKINEGNWGWRTVYLTNIANTWQEVTIPLADFQRVGGWYKTNEFVITFENSEATVKKGAIYIDDIEFQMVKAVPSP